LSCARQRDQAIIRVTIDTKATPNFFLPQGVFMSLSPSSFVIDHIAKHLSISHHRNLVKYLLREALPVADFSIDSS
jgi:hypothetical protein